MGRVFACQGSRSGAMHFTLDTSENAPDKLQPKTRSPPPALWYTPAI